MQPPKHGELLWWKMITLYDSMQEVRFTLRLSQICSIDIEVDADQPRDNSRITTAYAVMDGICSHRAISQPQGDYGYIFFYVSWLTQIAPDDTMGGCILYDRVTTSEWECFIALSTLLTKSSKVPFFVQSSVNKN